MGAMIELLLAIMLASHAVAAELPRIRDCDICPTMVVLPAGRFIMGAEGQRPAFAPAIDRAIESPFAIAETETTFDQYQLCVEAGVCRGGQDDHGWGRGSRPVINVDWDDANIYASWLTRVTGKAYRLPTEAEWEYAARAGTVTAYSWGDDVGVGHANCRSCGADPFGGNQSAPVASFPPNPFGLRDMSGNVSEWVADCWSERHDPAREEANHAACPRRVTRGGDWYYIPALATSAARMGNVGSIASYTIGFRVARTIEAGARRP